jgi:ornithine cyclodeaminase/alanine dehydrogenase-like protein (mu-crystallin family)
VHVKGAYLTGAQVTAAGSDMPYKQDLEPRVLAAASKYVPDNIDAAAASGELHRAGRDVRLGDR